MCDATPDCQREPVVLVDVAFPDGAEWDPSTDDADRSQPLPSQRIGFCVRHAVDAGLEDAGPLVDARAVSGMRAKGRFPDGHACADGWSWTVS